MLLLWLTLVAERPQAATSNSVTAVVAATRGARRVRIIEPSRCWAPAAGAERQVRVIAGRARAARGPRSGARGHDICPRAQYAPGRRPPRRGLRRTRP